MQCSTLSKNRENILLFILFICFIIWLTLELLNTFFNISFFSIVTSSLLSILVSFSIYKFYNFKISKALPIPLFKTNELFLLLFIIFIALITFVTSLLSAPNEGDSLAYHLPRTFYWMQNQNINPFPTHITRQNEYPPFAEYVLLIIQTLSNSDRFVNLSQWFFAIATLIPISLISKILGASRLTQIVTCLLVITLPNGITQMATTQNDHVANFFSISAIYLLLKLSRDNLMPISIIAGIAIGLALLTKGTPLFLIIPFFLIFLFLSASQNPRKTLISSIIIILITLIINAPFQQRLHIIKTNSYESSKRLLNEDLGATPLFLNITRNLAMHLSTPWDNINKEITLSLKKTAHSLGYNINDPKYTFPKNSFQIVKFSYADMFATCPLHLLLILIALTFTIINSIKRFLAQNKPINNQSQWLYALGLLSGVLLFNLLLKWQPFHTRFHLLFFIASMPLFALWLASKRHEISLGVSLLLFLWAIPFAIYNPQRPLLGENGLLQIKRSDQLLMQFPQHKKELSKINETIKESSCRQIGIINDETSLEYPLLYTLKESLGSSMRIEHINTPKYQINYPQGPFTPCYIIVFNSTPNDIKYLDKAYTPLLKGKNLSLYH